MSIHIEHSISEPACPAGPAPPVYCAPSGRGAFRRLDANEGPPPPAEFLAAALAEAAPVVAWYPEYDGLREAAARAFGVAPESVVPVNGADEGIRLWLEAFGGPGVPLLLPEPTFPMYRVYAGLTGTPVIPVPLRADFDLDPEAVAAALPHVAVLAVVSPNNPSGRRVSEPALRFVLHAAAGRPVLVDEVYAPFCGQDFVPLLAEFPNLVLLRSLSKAHGVPGLRCGFVLAAPVQARALDRRRSPYNVSAAAAGVGVAILNGDAGAPARRRAAVQARQALQGWLAAAGVSTVASDTHFCMLRLGEACGEAAGHMRSEGILVRELGTAAPGYLRVSVTGPDDVDAFAATFFPWWRGRLGRGVQP